MNHDWIIESELRRRCIPRELVRLEPRHWSANPALLSHQVTPGGECFLVTQMYGIETGVSSVSGEYTLTSQMRGSALLKLSTVKAMTPSAGLLGLAAPWVYETPTWFEGTIDITVARIFGGATYSLNLDIIVVIVEKEDHCQCT